MADELNTVELTIGVVSSYVSKNHVRASDVPELIANFHAAIAALDAPTEVATPKSEPDLKHEPAVTVRKSLASKDHIISLIDGKPYKTLKRHLGKHGLTPAEYRTRYGLKADYPMVAPNYSDARKVAAKALGLGRKVVAKVEAAIGIEPVASPAPKRRGRKPKAAAE